MIRDGLQRRRSRPLPVTSFLFGLAFVEGKAWLLASGSSPFWPLFPWRWCWFFFALLVAIWRFISLGSIIATASFPVWVYLLNHPPTPIAVGAACAAALIVGSHRANIRRLLNGTEKKLGEKP